MIVWPETDSAVQTMPAIAITKNIPVRPETPNSSRMTDEMMIVSIVMPDTGLRAVVAIAFAATDVKKNEKTSTRARPMRTTTDERPQVVEKDRHGDGRHDDADEDARDGDVAVGPLDSLALAVPERLRRDREGARR